MSPEDGNLTAKELYGKKGCQTWKSCGDQVEETLLKMWAQVINSLAYSTQH
jgi:hypothetical protein